MQIIKIVRLLAFFLFPVSVFCQSSYLPLGSKYNDLIDRLEIKTGNSNLNFSTIKPLNRRLYTQEVVQLDSVLMMDSTKSFPLTQMDKYNIDRFLLANSEWAQSKPYYFRKKPFLEHFYKTPVNFYEVNQKDFFLAVNPVVQYKQMFEKGNSQNLFYNSRGFTIRGMIGRKVGFDMYLTDNQERDPAYVQNWISTFKAVPGARFPKQFKDAGGRDYFDNRGSISFNASKYIDIQLGYDRNFIGDGYRSLFLSDFAPNAFFLKLNTRIWKLNYTNLVMELLPSSKEFPSGSKLLSRKYMRINYLGFNATKWLNVGLFDAVVFARENQFDFQYLIPVLFLRPAESDIGSGDNAIVGLNLKANIKKKVQVYGQLVLDEFLLKEIFKSNGYWANKFGYQIGVKYPDAFGIKDLDLQVENNRVRPFTYSHFDSLKDYSHSNQPLAHPLGAGFQENILLLKYHPLRHLYVQSKLIYYKQGLDSAGKDFGSNILRSYLERSTGGAGRDFGYFIGSGLKATSMNVGLMASYELLENMFIDADLQYRTYNVGSATSNTTIVSLGFRWNMARRVFDF